MVAPPSCSSFSGSEEAEDNVWNLLLMTLVHFTCDVTLQHMLSDTDLEKVALTCHFELDTLCEESHLLQAELWFAFLPDVPQVSRPPLTKSAPPATHTWIFPSCRLLPRKKKRP